MKRSLGALCAAVGAMLVLGAAQAKADILLWSTQAKPVEETQKMRSEVLSGFDRGKVNFQANDHGPWLTRIQAELEAGKGTVDVLGALHGELTSVSSISPASTSAVPRSIRPS